MNCCFILLLLLCCGGNSNTNGCCCGCGNHGNCGCDHNDACDRPQILPERPCVKPERPCKPCCDCCDGPAVWPGEECPCEGRPPFKPEPRPAVRPSYPNVSRQETCGCEE